MKTKKTTRGGNIFIKEGLCDPDDPATQLILWFFTMEPNFNDDLNKSCVQPDSEYLESLGPYACVIFDILQAAEVRRQDRFPAGNRKHHVASGLTHPLGYFNQTMLFFKGALMRPEWI